MASGKFVTYLRVSTDKQGRSGLGLAAQQRAVTDYLNGGEWSLLDEFVEVESGKRNDRPELARALRLCKKKKATLLIARLDRLARNVHFISGLLESGVDVQACDLPNADRFTLHILASVAEKEGKAISERTKLALQAAKERGTVLGRPNVTVDEWIGIRKAANIKRQENADAFASKVLRDVRHARSQAGGKTASLRAIAAVLNAEGVPARRGGEWTATAVQRVLERAEA